MLMDVIIYTLCGISIVLSVVSVIFGVKGRLGNGRRKRNQKKD